MHTYTRTHTHKRAAVPTNAQRSQDGTRWHSASTNSPQTGERAPTHNESGWVRNNAGQPVTEAQARGQGTIAWRARVLHRRVCVSGGSGARVGAVFCCSVRYFNHLWREYLWGNVVLRPCYISRRRNTTTGATRVHSGLSARAAVKQRKTCNVQWNARANGASGAVRPLT